MIDPKVQDLLDCHFELINCIHSLRTAMDAQEATYKTIMLRMIDIGTVASELSAQGLVVEDEEGEPCTVDDLGQLWPTRTGSISEYED